jgi:hypothetical protein
MLDPGGGRHGYASGGSLFDDPPLRHIMSDGRGRLQGENNVLDALNRTQQGEDENK